MITVSVVALLIQAVDQSSKQTSEKKVSQVLLMITVGSNQFSLQQLRAANIRFSLEDNIFGLGSIVAQNQNIRKASPLREPEHLVLKSLSPNSSTVSPRISARMRSVGRRRRHHHQTQFLSEVLDSAASFLLSTVLIKRPFHRF